jgi:ribokinase
MARVVVLGSSNTDLTVRLPNLPAPGETLLGGSFLSGPGGKGANQAVAARRAGAEVVFVTAVGGDRMGREALELYRAEGIDVAHAVVVPGAASGVALIFVAEAGENMIGVAPGANAHLSPAAIDALPDALFEREAVLLAGLEVPLETVARAVRRARRAGMRVVLNPAPADPRLLELEVLPLVDVLTPNRGELAMLAGVAGEESLETTQHALEVLRRRGATDVVVTLGSDGCLVAGPGGARRIPAFRVAAVDTVGAGDAFSGALAAALAEGLTLENAAVWAAAASALAVTQHGAQAALPRREAIERLAATYSPG